jgi:hypothetical protein
LGFKNVLGSNYEDHHSPVKSSASGRFLNAKASNNGCVSASIAKTGWTRIVTAPKHEWYRKEHVVSENL